MTETLVDTYGVDVIVGPACCSSATAASLVAARKGIPLISWACSAEHLSDKVRGLLHVVMRVLLPMAAAAAAAAAVTAASVDIPT